MDDVSLPEVVNELLPPSYSERAASEATLLRRSLLSGLSAAVGCTVGDEASAPDFKALLRCLRKLTTYQELRHPLPSASRLALVRDLWRGACLPGVALTAQAKCCNAITSLLNTSRRRSALVGRVAVPWREVYALLRASHVPDEIGVPAGGSQAAGFHRDAVRKLARSLRWYAPASAAQEVVAELAPALRSVHANEMLLAQSLLQLLFPVFGCDGAYWVPRWARL